MACSGNTTALEFLFVANLVPAPNLWGRHIVPNTGAFVSAHAGHHFREFARAQLDRVRGERGQGKHGVRHDLVDEHGYDTKMAMHVLRVLGEGVELMRTGRISMPRPEGERNDLIRVRRGEFTLAQVEGVAADRFEELETARLGSPLPPEIDRGAVSRIITDAMVEHWEWQHEPAKVFAKALSIAAFWISEEVKLHPGAAQPELWADKARVVRDITELAIKFREEEKNAR